MRFGVHIRIARGLMRGLDSARELGCEAVQLFSGNPNSWVLSSYDPDEAANFASRAVELGIWPVILHTPYLVNLASPDDATWTKSGYVLADAVRKASVISAALVVTHVGSHKGAGRAFGIRRVCEAVRFALDADSQPRIALELGSGSGYGIASRFEDARDILSELNRFAERVGVCLDTAHIWAAGYRIRLKRDVHTMISKFEHIVGLNKLWILHLNDTLAELGSHRDRHFHIGKGQIGIRGFKALVNHPALANLPGIIETPAQNSAWDARNLATLRRLRSAQ